MTREDIIAAALKRDRKALTAEPSIIVDALNELRDGGRAATAAMNWLRTQYAKRRKQTTNS